MIVSFSSGSLVTTVLLAASRSSTLCSKSSIEEVSVLKCSTVSLRVGSIGVFPSSSVRLESSSTRLSGFKPSTLFSRAPIPSPTSSFSCFSLRNLASYAKSWSTVFKLGIVGNKQTDNSQLQ